MRQVIRRVPLADQVTSVDPRTSVATLFLLTGDEITRLHRQYVLRRTKGKRSEAAAQLGITPQALSKWLRFDASRLPEPARWSARSAGARRR